MLKRVRGHLCVRECVCVCWGGGGGGTGDYGERYCESGKHNFLHSHGKRKVLPE